MTMRILILGASYGSLLGTKCLMAGHDVTLVCRAQTAALINEQGTHVQIRPKGHDRHLEFASADLPGTLDALTPDRADPSRYDFAVLAMQEPHYSDQSIRQLLMSIAGSRTPCISLMNMPPMPFLKRFPAIDADATERAFTNPRVWDAFSPELMSLCSPEPQAMRLPGQPPNKLHVGLATNFKAAEFGCAEANRKLAALASGIDEVRIGGFEVPVKLRPHSSIFVPFAKWSMLLAGNYRCVTESTPVSICNAVHNDLERSREIYDAVGRIVMQLGAGPDDLVPFDRYASAASGLTSPSSAARAIANGATAIERVDKLVQIIGRQFGIAHAEIDRTVDLVDRRLSRNSIEAA